MANHSKFIPWWKSLPVETRNDIAQTVKNNGSLKDVCEKYDITSSYMYYIKHLYGISDTHERDVKILNDYTSGVPDYLIKKEYGIDNAMFKIIKDLVEVVGFTSKELF